MSRDIKFRGLHPAVGVIMYVSVIDWVHDEVYFEQGTDVSYPIDDCNLMQFIGLEDKNGVEIYEGDILIGSASISKRHMLVKFADDVASFVIVDEIYGVVTISQEKINSFELAISGNIHQNPELLK